MKIKDLLTKINSIPKISKKEAYNLGKDCGLNGPNKKKLSFFYFFQ